MQSGQKGKPSAYYLFDSRTKKLIAGPDESLAALKRDPVVLKLEPQKAKTVTVHTKASKGKPAKTTTKVVPPGKTTPGLPDRLPGADRAEPDGRDHAATRPSRSPAPA